MSSESWGVLRVDAVCTMGSKLFDCDCPQGSVAETWMAPEAARVSVTLKLPLASVSTESETAPVSVTVWPAVSRPDIEPLSVTVFAVAPVIASDRTGRSTAMVALANSLTEVVRL